jgi:hypothetical protein
MNDMWSGILPMVKILHISFRSLPHGKRKWVLISLAMVSQKKKKEKEISF